MANSSTDKTSTKPHPLVVEQREKDIWYSLLVLRIVNALLLWTFFQPDEFYQAQEPAWWFAFGKGSHRWQDGAYNGPWITWVCAYVLSNTSYVSNSRVGVEESVAIINLSRCTRWLVQSFRPRL